MMPCVTCPAWVILMIISQTDVQRRGGPCSKYPVSCVVRDLLDAAGLLLFGKPLRVIDLTYGQGIWWYALKGKAIVAGFDPARLSWRVRPRCFFNSYAQRWPLLYHYKEMLEGEHIAGPVEFRHFLCIINKRARNCSSFFGILRVV